MSLKQSLTAYMRCLARLTNKTVMIKMAKKKKAAKEKKKEELLYVGVSDPAEVRRNILKTSKDIIEMRKKYEMFKRTRAEKLGVIFDLTETTKEVRSLVARAKKMLPRLPKEYMEESKPAPKQVKEKPKPVAAKQKQPEIKRPVFVPQKKTELDKLHDELSEVEEKLGSLG